MGEMGNGKSWQGGKPPFPLASRFGVENREGLHVRVAFFGFGGLRFEKLSRGFE
jgi:hypothetical protein